jgi:hypothetical protein
LQGSLSLERNVGASVQRKMCTPPTAPNAAYAHVTGKIVVLTPKRRLFEPYKVFRRS